MKTQRTLFLISLLFVGVLAAAGRSDGAPSSEPSPAASELVGDPHVGKETFTQYCSICHGVGATGFIGPHIGGINWTAPGLTAIVRGGVGGYGGMPAFNAEVVTDRNIADIAAYLASLPPAVSVAMQPSAAPTASALATSSPSPAASVPTSSPVSSTSAPVVVFGDPVHGRQVFTANCAACHGASGQGGFGPSMHGEKSRKDTAAAIAWIKNPRLPMPKLYPHPLSEKDVEDVAAYIESL